MGALNGILLATTKEKLALKCIEIVCSDTERGRTACEAVFDPLARSKRVIYDGESSNSS